ncbi:MAG: YihY/virulence factor BrkB family protein [Ruminococcus sp.]|nr:YihY/virulence factor BrkB family protein [Ruminococcus sp.]
MKNKNKPIDKIKYFLSKSKEDNISAIAAQSAFFLVLSIVPFLMFAFAVLSYFNIPREFYETYIQGVFVDDWGEKLRPIVDTTYANSIGIAFTTIIVALWSAGKGLYSITDGINRIYKIEYKRVWIIKRIYAMGYTLLMFLVMVLTVGLLIVTEFFDNQLRPFIKNLPYILGIIYTLRYFVVFAALLLLVSLAIKLYLRNKVDDKRWAKFRLQLPGVFLTALCWLGLSYGIRIYVKYFNGFSIYGSLTSIAVIMIWFYFSMYILLYGIQFNYINRREIYNFRFRKKKVDK